MKPWMLAIVVALGMSQCGSDDAWSACAEAEKQCKTSGSQLVPCCDAALDCKAKPGASTTYCLPRDGTVTTTTTTRPPATGTPTTKPPGTTPPGATTTTGTTTSRPATTTTLPPVPPGQTSFPAVRFLAKDVARRFSDSQDINFNPVTGAPANQYVRMVRALTQHTIYHPVILKAFRDFCPELLAHAVGTYNVVYGKFTIHYSLKDMPQPYEFHANYIMDLWVGQLDRLAECVLPEKASLLPPDVLALLQDSPPPPPELPKPPGYNPIVGAFDPKHVFQPLTVEQCNLVHQVHDAHEAGSPALRALHLALTQTARDPYEATLLDIMFVGPIDPTHTPERVAYLVQKVNETHTRWSDALHCGEGKPPDMVEAWIFNMEHARYHAMRNANVPGYAIRHAYDASNTIPKCRVEKGVDRKFNPKTKLWEWAREKYDNHACLEDDL